MEAAFQGRIRRQERQLQCYAQAHRTQKELLLRLYDRLQTAPKMDGTSVAHDTNGAAPSDIVAALLRNDGELHQRLSKALEEEEEEERQPVQLHGVTQAGGENGPRDNREGASEVVGAAETAALTGSTEAHLTASLAVVASDAASRFCEGMWRLWLAYFAHLHREVGGLLQRIDDAFAAFEADPSEETLAEFLEVQQQLRPLLSDVLGMHEGVEGREQQRQPKQPRSSDISVKASLPRGSPFEDETALVRHLSLCIAEATSPLLAIALRSSSSSSNNCSSSSRMRSSANEPCGEQRSTGDILDAEGMLGAATSELPIPQAAAIATECDCNPDGGTPDGNITDAEGGRRGAGSNSGNYSSPVSFRTSAGKHAGFPLHTSESSVELRKEQHQIYPPRMGRSNNSSQVERALYGGRCTLDMNPGVSSSSCVAPRHASCGHSRHSCSVSPSSAPTGTDDGCGFGGRGASLVAMVEGEGGVGAPEALDPYVHLRHLRMQEEKLRFLLVNTVSQQRDHGSEAKYYAMNKRLARIQSAILRAEREVNELQRIEEERAALRHERAIRQRKLRR